MTNYRSAVGARQPSRVVLHGISISYSDSGGSGPVVICLHAIGHGARDFEDLSRRLSPSRWTFPTMEIRGQIPSPPAARATRGSWRNSSMSCISQRLCCWALHRRSRFHPLRQSVSRRRQGHCALRLWRTRSSGPVGRVFIGGFVQFFAAGRRGAFWFPWAFARYYRKVLLKRAAQEERERIIRSAYEIAPTLEQSVAKLQ
jgi:4,5:9,10-diseco-3-hydroxy-5,9,17-trioxoandrosta-1(10),2-diene-4-oate hydrolase